MLNHNHLFEYVDIGSVRIQAACQHLFHTVKDTISSYFRV
jgi:hypothetical protein